jgi:hypothetical protein
MLLEAGQLDNANGWKRESCPTQDVGGRQESVQDCINLDTPAGASTSPTLVDDTGAKGYQLTFGSGTTSSTAIVQELSLPAGLFRFSWYTKESGTTGTGGQIAAPWSGGAGAGVIRAAVAPTILTEGIVPAVAPEVWNRRFIIFRVDSKGTARVGFARQSGTVTVSAPMLEQLQDTTLDQALVPFGNTGLAHKGGFPACFDTDGSTFRSTRWHKGCVKLCADGFADACTDSKAKDYCYWETDFSLSQRDIQLGKVFNFSGFARGNFNYRIDSIGLNFVGTSPRNCADAQSPQNCYSAGYLPYSLSHVGPFYVRNHQGDDVETMIFDGNIEHARGLASERVLTNPMSSTDQSLMDQYMRREFAGRPLDGNFVIRVWDENGVDFTSIEDVQVVLNYRYWTKFN